MKTIAGFLAGWLLLGSAASAERGIGAPSAVPQPNPYEGSSAATRAGGKLFLQHCAVCHGPDGHGRGKAPALDSVEVQAAPPGDLFRFLTNGRLPAGMPSWSGLPEARRWQIVTYVKTLAPCPPSDR